MRYNLNQKRLDHIAQLFEDGKLTMEAYFYLEDKLNKQNFFVWLN